MPEPFHIWLEGPITDPAALDRFPLGTACVDDVGTIRTRRYGNTHMAGGWWSHKGDNPLNGTELTERGTRPVWIIHISMSEREPIEVGCYVVAQPLHPETVHAPERHRVEAVHDDSVLLAGVGHVSVKTAGLVRVPPPE